MFFIVSCASISCPPNCNYFMNSYFLDHEQFGRMPIEFAVRCGTLKDVNILFPLTSPMPTVPDWSVRGIIRHVNTLPGQKVLYELWYQYCISL